MAKNETATVTVILNGQRANATLKEIEVSARALTAELRKLPANSKEFEEKSRDFQKVNARLKSIKQEVYNTSTALDKMMQIAGGISIAAIAGRVWNGIVNGIKGSIEAYREQEKAVQKVEQAIKQTGGTAGLSLRQLTDEATRLQKNTIFGDEEILNKSTAQLLTFTNITGDTFLKAQQAAMDLSTVLEGDLQNASIMVGKALNNPTIGLTALRKVGVSFTEDQVKLIKELAKTNQLEEAQAIILQELNRQYGGQAEAVAKGLGVLEQTRNKLGEVSETIGGFLGKIITPFALIIGDLAEKFNALISPAKKANERFEEQGKFVARLVDDIDPLLDRYDELKSKTELNAQEQNELKVIIGQITSIMPGAATEFDKYGNAISVSTDRMRDFIQGQRLLLQYENKEAIEETISALALVNVQLNAAQTRLNEIKQTGTFKTTETTYTPEGAIQKPAIASQTEVADVLKRNQQLINEQTALNTKLSQLRGDYLADFIKKKEQETNASLGAAKIEEEIRTYSIEQLKELAEGEDKTMKKLAMEELKRRENLQKELKKHQDYLQKIQVELEDARVRIIQDARERELKLEELAFRRKLEQIKGFSDQENQLRQALTIEHNQKISDINTKFDKLEAEKRKIVKVKNEEDINREIEKKLDDRFQDEWTAEKMHLERTGQMTYAKRREILEQERDMELALAADNADKQTLIWEEYYAKLKQLEQNHFTEIESYLQSALSVFEKLYGAYIASENSRDEIRLKQYENNIEERKKILQESLDAGVITHAQYDQALKNLDKQLAQERARIAEEQAEREYEYAVIMVTLQSAIAIAGAIARATTGTVTNTWIEAVIAIVAAVATVVTEITLATNKLNEARSMGQFAKGKYDVVGADDGRTYRDVPYTGRAKTGIYARPAIVAEIGPELIVDAPTTRNIQLNYPWILGAINHARVPQFAAGTIDSMAGSAGGPQFVVVKDPELQQAVDRLNERLEKGILARLVYSEYEAASDKVNDIKNNTTR